MLKALLDALSDDCSGDSTKSDKYLKAVEDLKKEMSDERHTVHSIIIFGMSDKGIVSAIEPDIKKLRLKHVFRLRKKSDVAFSQAEDMAVMLDDMTDNEKEKWLSDAENERKVLLAKAKSATKKKA